MQTRVLVSCTLLALASAGATSCIESQSEVPDPSDGGFRSSDGGSDGTVSQESSVAFVRFAHLVPDGPALDVCLRRDGSEEYEGPVLKTGGLASGLAYGQVSARVAVPVGSYADVRVVAAGSKDCASGIGPSHRGIAPLVAGAHFTLFVSGVMTNIPGTSPDDGGDAEADAATEGGPTSGIASPPAGLSIEALLDVTTPKADVTKLRFIQAAPGLESVDVGLGGGELFFQPLFVAVSRGSKAAPVAAFDSAGYLERAPLEQEELTLRGHASTGDLVAAKPFSSAAGTARTVFAMGGVAGKPLNFLVCDDTSDVRSGLSPCEIVGASPERARLRLGHFSASLPAKVDVCLRPKGGATSSFAGPVARALGIDGGLGYRQLTRGISLPTGEYELRIVAADDTTCDAPIAGTDAFALPAFAAGTQWSGGPYGELGADGGQALKAGAWVDETAAEPNNHRMRAVHLMPGQGDVSLRYEGGDFGIFDRVSYGGVPVQAFEENGGASAAGYVSIPGNDESPTDLRIGVEPSITYYYWSKILFPSNQLATVFLTNLSTNLEGMRCVDAPAPSTALSECTTFDLMPPTF